MKRCAQFFSAALTVAMLSSAADAATIDFMPFDAANIDDGTDHISTTSDHHMNPPVTTFSNEWKFSIRARSAVEVYVRESIEGLHTPLFNITKFDKFVLVSLGGSFSRTDTPKNPNAYDAADEVKFYYPDLKMGDYSLTVSGESGNFTNGGGPVRPWPPDVDAGYRYQIKLSAHFVPIPATMWLFLTALGGLGMIGYRPNRSSMES